MIIMSLNNSTNFQIVRAYMQMTGKHSKKKVTTTRKIEKTEI